MSVAAIAPESGTRQATVNAILLSVAGAFIGAIAPVTVVLGGLAGTYLLGVDKSLATLPIAAMNIGLAFGTLPAAGLMRRVGRRAGFLGGAAVGITGALAAAGTIALGNFWLFVASMLLVGISNAFVQQYRFAAADTGSAAFRAKAISWIMIGGIATAIIGPQTAIHAADLLAPVPFAGAFVGAAGLCVIGLLALLALGGEARQPLSGGAAAGPGRSLAVIARQPRFIVAVICATASYGLMTFLMTAAPLAMEGCGIGRHDAALGIQWHIIAMFAPSFVTGPLIARFGAERIVAIGLVMIAVCAAVAVAGISIINFWVSLIILGVGWNFGFIGATALLTSTYRPEERSRVQGVNDLLVFGLVALASLASGKLLTAAGWATINVLAFPIAAIGLAGVAYLLFRRAPRPA